MTKYFNEILTYFNNLRPELGPFQVSRVLMEVAKRNVENFLNNRNGKAKCPKSVSLYKELQVQLDVGQNYEFKDLTKQLQILFDKLNVNLHNSDVSKLGFYIDVIDNTDADISQRKKLIGSFYFAYSRKLENTTQIIREDYLCLLSYNSKRESPRSSLSPGKSLSSNLAKFASKDDDSDDFSDLISLGSKKELSQPLVNLGDKLAIQQPIKQPTLQLKPLPPKPVLPLKKNPLDDLSDDDDGNFSFDSKDDDKPATPLKIIAKAPLELSATPTSKKNEVKHKSKYHTMDLSQFVSNSNNLKGNKKLDALRDEEGDDDYVFD
ncbi:hypothetical protein TVAG_281890 [Trichomonas vaginalis G3]|uniref:Uncharacterized protein n=1 Tax=Trichomonas vaginalis (strain ATCC PRA-98 / G3) TaxID=412133 RepID=A2E9Q4_TRIV3|nr:hypothetical protein TVAGG3_0043230 [Trichomonas vaginalis G3]EAY10589.1 hypothetical protein TVAG_281890 [Trichomonas vaginalis G3]KAI5540841.1 hypothetical protein TVAGG3_0043230 [Trichomonas vaginalis G3]|eukprot:XP_001322812.1 hypothetical protein [Trichomonas vaginalis G3]